MSFILRPWQLLLLILAGWVNREQQKIIEYLRTENQILRESHGRKRIRLNANQRRRLAIKGKILGPKLLEEIASVVTPDTIDPSVNRLANPLESADWECLVIWFSFFTLLWRRVSRHTFPIHQMFIVLHPASAPAARSD